MTFRKFWFLLSCESFIPDWHQDHCCLIELHPFQQLLSLWQYFRYILCFRSRTCGSKWTSSTAALKHVQKFFPGNVCLTWSVLYHCFSPGKSPSLLIYNGTPALDLISVIPGILFSSCPIVILVIPLYFLYLCNIWKLVLAAGIPWIYYSGFCPLKYLFLICLRLEIVLSQPATYFLLLLITLFAHLCLSLFFWSFFIHYC